MNWLKKLYALYLERKLVEAKSHYEMRVKLHGSGAYIYADVLAVLHSEVCVLQWKLDLLKEQP
jgi:hypothetical protein